MDTNFIGNVRRIATPACIVIGLIATAPCYAGPAVRPAAQIGSNGLVRPSAQIGSNGMVRPSAQIGSNGLVRPSAQIGSNGLVRPSAQIGSNGISRPDAQTWLPMPRGMNAFSRPHAPIGS